MAEIDNDRWWHHIVCCFGLNPKKKNPIIKSSVFCHWCETHGLIRTDYGSKEICTFWVWVRWLCVLPFQSYAPRALALGCQVSSLRRMLPKTDLDVVTSLRRTAAGWKEPPRKIRNVFVCSVWPSQKSFAILNVQVFVFQWKIVVSLILALDSCCTITSCLTSSRDQNTCLTCVLKAFRHRDSPAS